MRITKKEFMDRGGLRNPNLYRQWRGGRWRYLAADTPDGKAYPHAEAYHKADGGKK